MPRPPLPPASLALAALTGLAPLLRARTVAAWIRSDMTAEDTGATLTTFPLD